MSRLAMPGLKRVFFGYASRPAVEREAMANAAMRLSQSNVADTRTWEELRISGKVLVDVIEDEIKAADLSVFDVTHLNQNVMYELGFAIGANKPIWLLRDTTDADAAALWRRFGVLTTLGYAAFTNSEDISRAFLKDRPDHNAVTLYEETIAPDLRPSSRDVLFHVPGYFDTEIDMATARELQWRRRRGYRYVAADVRESGVQPLSWYGQNVYDSVAVVANLMPPRRVESAIHNALASLVCGIARGMSRHVQLLAEEEWSTGLDYRDLVHVCGSSRDCESYVNSWLDGSLPSNAERAAAAQAYHLRLELATELASLRLGDPVAENEETALARYFVETSAYREVLEPRTTVFVGAKGTGKTASFIRARDELGGDARVLVGVIRPASYEWQSVLRALGRPAEHDLKDYVAESLWEFLLLSEVALLAANWISDRPATPLPGSPQDRLLALLETHQELREASFSIRLERIAALLEAMPAADTVDVTRQNIASILHAGLLKELKDCLVPVLADKARVAILIDNLDKAWQRDSASGDLGHFLLGLLGAASRISQSFYRRDKWHSPTDVTIALFLRADIFEQLARLSREPDKLPVTQLAWDDPEALIRVIEERYVAARGEGADPDSLWSDCLCPVVHGMTTRSYLTWRVLPRPRDIIQLANAALGVAVNRRHGRVLEEDFLTAEKQYSQFAYSVLLVEDDLGSGRLEGIVFELAGSAATVVHSDLVAILGKADGTGNVEDVVDYLLRAQFLGLETRDGHFEYAAQPASLGRNKALGRRLAEQRRTEVRYCIHPAFRPYLDIADPPLTDWSHGFSDGPGLEMAH